MAEDGRHSAVSILQWYARQREHLTDGSSYTKGGRWIILRDWPRRGPLGDCNRSPEPPFQFIDPVT